jgi:serine/threonine protein kinase
MNSSTQAATQNTNSKKSKAKKGAPYNSNNVNKTSVVPPPATVPPIITSTKSIQELSNNNNTNNNKLPKSASTNDSLGTVTTQPPPQTAAINPNKKKRDRKKRNKQKQLEEKQQELRQKGQQEDEDNVEDEEEEEGNSLDQTLDDLTETDEFSSDVTRKSNIVCQAKQNEHHQDEEEEGELDDDELETHELFIRTVAPQLLAQKQHQMFMSKMNAHNNKTKRIESPEPTSSFVTQIKKKQSEAADEEDEEDGGDNDDEEETDEDEDQQDGGTSRNVNSQKQQQLQQQSSNENENGSDNEEQEDIADYCKGGYHPVKIGDLYSQRYHVLRKLGWGHFSTVWLCWDFKAVRFAALKIVKSAKHYTEAAADEIKLLQCARDGDPTDENRFKTVQLLDDFKVTGPNGVHVCMVFEVLGNNLLKLIIKSNYHGIPLQNVKLIVKQVLQGLDYLHRKCQIIHTDMKPENVLMCVDETHVRHLAQEAAEWQRMGIKPSGSAVATVNMNMPGDAESVCLDENGQPIESNNKMSKNKKKKMRKKQKRIQTLLETQQKQIELLETNNLNLLGYDTTVNTTTTNQEVNSNTHILTQLDAASSDMTTQDLTSSQNKRMSKLMSIVQDVNIDNLVNNVPNMSGGSKSEFNLKLVETPVDANSSKLDHTAQSSEFKQTKKNRKRAAQKARKKAAAANVASNSNSNSKPSDSNTSSNIMTKSAMNVVDLTDQADKTNKSTKPSSSLSPSLINSTNKNKSYNINNATKSNSSNKNSGQTNTISTVAQQVVELKRKHLNPVFEVIMDEKNLQVKIADLGNACWTYHHFTEDIQTRQYRSLEVILGAGYGPSADLWSLACMAFELATGDYLFEPHSGENYSRDEDHIAHIIELLGPVPYDIAMMGKYSSEFFNKRGQLRHINQLRPWELYEVLTEKYEWSTKDASEFSDFLLPMLNYNIYERATALECLNHPWITGSYPSDYIFRTLNHTHSAMVAAELNGGNLASATIPPQGLILPPHDIHMRGGMHLVDGQGAVFQTKTGEDDDEDQSQTFNSLFLLNMKKRRRKLFNKMQAGEHDVEEEDDDDEDDEESDEDDDDDDEDEEETDDDDDDDDYEEDDEEDDIAQMNHRRRILEAAAAAAFATRNGGKQPAASDLSQGVDAASTMSLNEDLINRYIKNRLKKSNNNNNKRKMPNGPNEDDNGEVEDDDDDNDDDDGDEDEVDVDVNDLKSFTDSKDLQKFFRINNGILDSDKLTLIMLKQQQQQQQQLRQKQHVSAAGHIDPNQHVNLENQSVLNRLIQKQKQQQQNLPPQNNMSNIEYQKWLLTMGRQQLVGNVNRDINSRIPDETGHTSATSSTFNFNHNYKNGNHVHNHAHAQSVAAAAQAAAQPSNKLSEVERIKQELLGYQREIEMMQKKQEHAKMLKQQQNQLKQQQLQQIISNIPEPLSSSITQQLVTSASNLINSISPTENKKKLNRQQNDNNNDDDVSASNDPLTNSYSSSILPPHARLLSSSNHQTHNNNNPFNNSSSSMNDKFLDCNEDFQTPTSNNNNLHHHKNNDTSTYHDACDESPSSKNLAATDDDEEEETDLKRFERLSPSNFILAKESSNCKLASSSNTNLKSINSTNVIKNSNATNDDSIEIANLINQFRQLKNNDNNINANNTAEQTASNNLVNKDGEK